MRMIDWLFRLKKTKKADLRFLGSANREFCYVKTQKWMSSFSTKIICIEHLDDVPRNLNDWPVIPPKDFTPLQLYREASSWATLRGSPYVGGHEFKKYNDELISRGLIMNYDHIEVDWD